MTSAASPNTTTQHNPAATTMLFIGILAVIAGGLLSAVTSPLSLEYGSWASAFLVLVVGVAQIAMTLQRRHHDAKPSTLWLQCAAWNLGAAAVIAGTFLATTLLVDLGSISLVVALMLALQSSRRQHPVNRWTIGYRLLLLTLMISIPIGIVLSHLRH